MDPLTAHRKFDALIKYLGGCDGAVLAFSGGVDSSFLLKAMKLSGVGMLAVTAVSETMPRRDREDAESLALSLGVEHLLIKTDDLGNEEFARNAPDRCFHCKDMLFGRLREISRERGLKDVFDGSNSDDLSDYRPGRRAAGLHGVRSPLAECGLAKEEIRLLSKELDLPTWDKPSSPCLSSRFPYGTRITLEGIERVRMAEEALRGIGLKVLRVRHHGDTARIEVGAEEMQLLLADENRRLIVERLRQIGYAYVTLDLEGYRTGSLNRMLGRE